MVGKSLAAPQHQNASPKRGKPYAAGSGQARYTFGTIDDKFRVSMQPDRHRIRNILSVAQPKRARGDHIVPGERVFRAAQPEVGVASAEIDQPAGASQPGIHVNWPADDQRKGTSRRDCSVGDLPLRGYGKCAACHGERVAGEIEGILAHRSLRENRDTAN